MKEVYVMINKEGKHSIIKVKVRLIEYKGIQLGLQGDGKKGYMLLHINSGLLINGKLYNHLDDYKEDLEVIYNIISQEKVKKQLEEAEIELNKLIKESR